MNASTSHSQKQRMLYFVAGLGAIIVIYFVFNFLQQKTQPTKPVTKTSDEWQEILTPEQYRITRKAGTEPPFSSPLDSEKRAGTYYDVTGEQALFRSEDKFDSGTGWPSFTKPISPDALVERTDYKIGYPRTEILSSMHGHHLGHVFSDGPEPTGLRYCMNGLALKFVPDEE